MNSGWIEFSKLENLDDRFLAEIKSLSPMPDIFSFDQKCPHLTEYGGYYDGEYWNCFGCGIKLVFNDKK